MVYLTDDDKKATYFPTWKAEGVAELVSTCQCYVAIPGARDCACAAMFKPIVGVVASKDVCFFCLNSLLEPGKMTAKWNSYSQFTRNTVYRNLHAVHRTQKDDSQPGVGAAWNPGAPTVGLPLP